MLDLRRVLSRLPRLDGLLISGDIAFAGKQEEYAYGENWIESVRELLGCGREAVMLTPGNHDMDRQLIPANGEVDLLQSEIRDATTPQEYDDRLAAALRDENRGGILFVPLAAYNAFAKVYGCEVSPARPFWERDFKLRDRTTVRFRGITTTLLSGSRDNEQTHKMLYGGAQRAILREPNVRYAIIGHHPPSWTIEGDIADQLFSTLAFLQVFGHVHTQWATRIGNSVRFIAGAVHPSRDELAWNPRYSAIAISAVDNRHLAIRIYPRRWSTEEIAFIPDFNSAGQDYRDYTVDVEPRGDLGS